MLPRDLAPMLATPGPLPQQDGRWEYEVKWDGVRVLVAVEAGQVRLRSRSGGDVTAAYPELADLTVPAGDALLDGEVVALGADGQPDFGLLQSRMHVRDPRPDLRARVPVTLLLFDVLHAAGRSLLDVRYLDRRELLGTLGVVGAQVPGSFPEGAALFASTREQGLEGVVAKRRDSRYEPGRRSDCWVKVKHVRRQSAVVVGWQAGDGGRASTLGSLLLAVPRNGSLAYCGHVGTGFSSATLQLLTARLASLSRDVAPADDVPAEHARTAHWVEPVLVVEVEFSAWTRDRRLRHPSFKGLRDDLDPMRLVTE